MVVTNVTQPPYAEPEDIDPADHCCETMVYALQSDHYVYYVPAYRIWGIGDQDREEGANILITHCPWCGKELPPFLSPKWANEMREREIPFDTPELPEDLRTDRWWKAAGL